MVTNFNERLLRQRKKQSGYNATFYQKNRKEILAERAQDYKERGGEIRAQARLRRRERGIVLKREVLTHYGGGKCACVRCGEARLACLSIDHINGGGTQHIKEIGIGSYFYKWLKNNDYPKGYQTLCMNDQWVKRVENNEGISK